MDGGSFELNVHLDLELSTLTMFIEWVDIEKLID
jgi:hypothetical protein